MSTSTCIAMNYIRDITPYTSTLKEWIFVQNEWQEKNIMDSLVNVGSSVHEVIVGDENDTRDKNE